MGRKKLSNSKRNYIGGTGSYNNYNNYFINSAN